MPTPETHRSPEEQKPLAHIYFACALHGPNHSPLPEETRQLYDRIAKHLRENFYTIYMPHEEVFGGDMSASAVYAHSEHQVRRADIVLCYAGLPASGAGIEIGMANRLKIPAVLFLEVGKQIERSVQGSANVFFRFGTMEELDERLLASLGGLKVKK